MKRFILALVVSLSFRPVFAAAPTLLNKGNFSGYVHFKPQAVPTGVTVVTPNDALIDMIVVTATSATTFSISDGQGTPIPIYPTVTTTSQTTYMASFPAGYYAPGGIIITAGGSGLTYYMSFKQ